LLWKRKWQWFLCIKLYYYLYSYFLSSFYIQNSLPLINTNTKYWKQIIIFPLKWATFSISVCRQHPSPLVNEIFLPTIAALPLWTGGGEENKFDSANEIWRDMHQHFKDFVMYYDIKTRSKKPCHYRLFLLNLMLVRQARYVYCNIYL
jgi:hypothetical protein